VATFALITPSGCALGLYELDDDETEPGAVIRRPREPGRRVIGLLDDGAVTDMTCSSSSALSA